MIIKRATAFLVAAVMLLALSVSVFAEDIYADSNSDDDSKILHSVYSCEYDPESEQISINGTVPHDLFIKYSKHTVMVYKLSRFDGAEQETELVASSEMTIKFHFSFAVESVFDLFSSYVVIFVSDSGEIAYTGPELYPSVKSEYLLKGKDFYKGLSLSEDIPYTRANASTYIIPVEYQRLFNINLGYIYMLGNESFFFDRDYLSAMDTQVRTLSSCGAQVYFQLVMPSDENSGRYQSLYFNDSEVVKQMYACLDFLSQRYCSDENGRISGIILGKKLDSFIANELDEDDIDAYSQNLAMWGVVAGGTVRKNIPSADIVYSFSSVNSFDGRTINEAAGYRSDVIIENLSEFFDAYYSDGFDFSIMIESDMTPFNITVESVLEGIDTEKIPDSRYISPQTANILSKYLKDIKDRYASSPESFIYYWEATEDLNADALGAAYVYSYYKLLNNAQLSSFVADFGNLEKEAFLDCLNIFRDIDSSYGKERTDKILKLFGVSGWEDIISDFDRENLIFNTSLRAEPIVIKTKNMKGTFSYFDCVDNTKVLPWRKGLGCKSLSISYNSLSGRALRAHLSSEGLPEGEYSYIVYKDEYPENYSHTQYLVFDLSIESDDTSEVIPYEIKITIGEGKNLIECSQAVSSGKKSQIAFEMSEFSAKHLGDYIRIAVRPLSDSSSDYSLYISSVVGLSDEYSSEELESRISEDRLRIRNELVESDLLDNKNKISVVAVILVIGVIVGATLFIFLRYDDNPEKK